MSLAVSEGNGQGFLFLKEIVKDFFSLKEIVRN